MERTDDMVPRQDFQQLTSERTRAARSSRLRAASVLIAAGLVGMLAACSASTPVGGNEDEGGKDHISVESVYGPVTVNEPASDVLALTTQHAAMLVSLGVQPVAVGFSKEDLEQQAPWLSGKLDTVFDTELADIWGNSILNLEAAVGYEPDLIVGNTYQIPEDVYNQAASAAPTFAGLGGESTWEHTIEALAALTGTDAGAVLSSVEQICAAAQEELPEWQDRTYQFIRPDTSEIMFGGGEPFECLGLVPADNQIPRTTLSLESIDQLDANLLLVYDAYGVQAQIEGDPRFESLPSSTSGAALWFNSLPLAVAVNNPDPYSWDYLIEQVRPVLKTPRD